MFRTLLQLLLILCAAPGFAQKHGEPITDSLFYLGYARDSIAALGTDRLMVVPFHPDRYMSEIDRQIGEAGGYNFQQVRGFWRKGLSNALVIAARQCSEPIDMHADKGDVNMDLDFIYKVMGYDYREYVIERPEPGEMEPRERLASSFQRAKEKLSREESGPAPGARIQEGQLVHVADTKEKMTVAKVYNPIIWDSLQPKYRPTRYLFVNELTLLNAPESPYALQSGSYSRAVSVHYTVFNQAGGEWYSDVEKVYFSSHQNDLRQIISEHFVIAGNNIVEKYNKKRFSLAGLKPVAFLPVEE